MCFLMIHTELKHDFGLPCENTRGGSAAWSLAFGGGGVRTRVRTTRAAWLSAWVCLKRNKEGYFKNDTGKNTAAPPLNHHRRAGKNKKIKDTLQ